MAKELTLVDLELIQQSLDYTIRAFEDCQDYPTYEYKLMRVADARATRDRVRDMARRVRAEARA